MDSAQSIEIIPVNAIDVVNPRVRNRRIFKEIVTSVAELGLKRPITVKRKQVEGEQRYDLVCGQGRLEAYQSLGQREIPAIVVSASNEDSAIMSLVENCARRQHRAIDLLHDIEGLKNRGYQFEEIARKTGLTVEYVRGVASLLENGEHRLLRAVEAGQVPVSVAVLIAQAEDSEVQNVLQQAYEEKLLRGQRLMAAKKLIEQRRRRGTDHLDLVLANGYVSKLLRNGRLSRQELPGAVVRIPENHRGRGNRGLAPMRAVACQNLNGQRQV
jgi:ParB family transcriptional regulator, chromosome partitioning protein